MATDFPDSPPTTASSHAAAATAPSPVGRALEATEAWATRMAGRIAGEGPHWAWRTVFVVWLLLLVMSFPSLDKLHDARYMECWPTILSKSVHPFTQTYFDPSTHEAQLTFRLVVVLLARLVGGGMAGCLFWEFLSGWLLLYWVARLTERHTGDRVLAVWMTLLVASIHAGAEPWIDLRGSFDGFALCALLWAMWSRRPLWIATCFFLAAGTDERGLIASSLVWLYHASRISQATPVPGAGGVDSSANPGRDLGWRGFATPGALGVMGGWAIYFAVRCGLATAFGLTTATGGTGLHYIANQINLVPVGLWSGLEGGWLIVGAAVVVLVAQRQTVTASLYVLGLTLVSVVAFSVADITRSMVYLLPSFIIGLGVLGAGEPRAMVRRLGLVALILALLWPMYIVFGKFDIWWHYPLPVHLVRWLLMPATAQP